MTKTWTRKRHSFKVKARRLLFVGALVVYLVLVSAGLTLRSFLHKDGHGVGVETADIGRDRDSVGDVEFFSRFVGKTGERRLRREADCPPCLDQPENLVTGHGQSQGRSQGQGHAFQAGQGRGEGLEAVDENNETCRPRAVDNFPGNFFSLKDTQDGGVVIHILIALYLFASLAIVCDDYFVPALERICEDLGLQEDVAGATFMAAGSSAPELCTSIVGVFIAQNDIGVGTIVGSAVFNILFIVGVCGLLAGMVVELTWYPLLRDTLFYLLSVVILVIVIQDSRVHWYEALIMLLAYVLYILLMYFNRRLEDRAVSALASLRLRLGKPPSDVGPAQGEKAALLEQSGEHGARERERDGSPSARGSGGRAVEEAETGFHDSIAVGDGAAEGGESEGSGDDVYESPWEIPATLLPRVYWVAMVPVKAACYVSIPDCRRKGVWRRLYPLTFFASVVWIAGFTYLMVWMITIAGDALDIPDTVMGLTLLAAGTSLPDCLASVFVARDGYGDMAVSNSIGSNVFDILLCLGLPWFIEAAIVKKAGHLEISSSGMLYAALTLLATVVFLLVSVALNRWRLTKKYGVVCLAVYVLVTALSSLYELNVFADLNPPACPR